MDNKSQFLSVFCAYIKQYIKVLLLFIVFALVFCIVFSLYNLETEAIYYSIILCAFIGLIYKTRFLYHWKIFYRLKL